MSQPCTLGGGGSIQRRALRLVDAADPPDSPAQFEPVSPLDSLEHRGGRRGACGIPQGTGAECHTWLGYDSLRESPREARERCLPVVMQWRCRVPVPASTQSTFVGRVSRIGTFSRPLSPHIQEMNTQNVKLAANRWDCRGPPPLTLVIL
ncbi:hypothetical protein GWK47_013959 [Chionoecetes opilio]|uniref:Uncharacterized protein n=1 Tax=Chionoecetes opilio TaxID=41210 RepID=A0A8J4Y441_CHIOP|nr:hypothetical protein GWK47_013959 [Chionoecetes opilio]